MLALSSLVNALAGRAPLTQRSVKEPRGQIVLHECSKRGTVVIVGRHRYLANWIRSHLSRIATDIPRVADTDFRSLFLRSICDSRIDPFAAYADGRPLAHIAFTLILY